ncbi:carbohydrate ABC transporter permease [Microbacterium sp. NPDC077644]|uniref:carbohydrate ABC transporter permease n=1 Tax=Microbacterium sp. NPDC077644 TaxID=3155055 RepID=UPI00344B970F
MTALRPIRALAVYGMLSLAAAVTLLPFLLSFATAFKSPTQFATSSPLTLPAPWTLENFSAVLGDQGVAEALGTTTLTVIVMTAVQLPLSVFAAYAFALLQFPLRKALFWVYLITMLIPAMVLVMPLYLMLMLAGFAGTFWGLVMPFLLGSPFAIFLLRQHFCQIPREVLDADRVDGAGAFGILFRVVLPLSRPVITALALITVVSQWNAFLWPRVIAGTDWRVLTDATLLYRNSTIPIGPPSWPRPRSPSCRWCCSSCCFNANSLARSLWRRHDAPHRSALKPDAPNY